MSHLQPFAETISWAQEVRLSTSRAVLELPHAPGDKQGRPNAELIVAEN